MTETYPRDATLASALRAETRRVLEEEKCKNDAADIIVAQVKLAIIVAMDNRESPLGILLWDAARRKFTRYTVSFTHTAFVQIHAKIDELVNSKMMHRLHVSGSHSGVKMDSTGDGMGIVFDWSEK